MQLVTHTHTHTHGSKEDDNGYGIIVKSDYGNDVALIVVANVKLERFWDYSQYVLQINWCITAQQRITAIHWEHMRDCPRQRVA